MFKKLLALAICVCLAVLTCGCNLFTVETDDLLGTPELSGDLKPIAEAIKSSAGNEYTLKYPTRGIYRSAVVREDIDSDGLFEAFAFYSTTDGETVTMNINVVRKTDDSWKSVATQQIVAGGVDKVEFCDLDADGIKEILVGWEIYGTSEMQLAVYSLEGTVLTQRLLQRYTHFITCDLDANGENEIFAVRTANDQSNAASVFELTDDGASETAFVKLDSSSRTVNEPILSTLQDGRTAIYLDEVKGAGAVTEVLYMKDGILCNPLYSSETGETAATLRAVSFETKDIDGDGILEIPVQENIPAVTRTEANEKLYLTNWCTFNGETLTNKMSTMMNLNDGYYLIIPPKWAGSIAVLKDTENKLREIYRYNAVDGTVGESLVYIKSVSAKDWQNGKYKATGIKEILTEGKTTYICKISATAEADGVNESTVKDLFKILE